MSNKTVLICNADDNSLLKYSPHPSILDRNSFDKHVHNGEFNNVDRFIISAQLNWSKKDFSDFHGLEIIKELRVKSKSKASILVTSHFPYEKVNDEFCKQASGNFRFLQDSGVNYISTLDVENIGFKSLDDKFKPQLDEKLLDYLLGNLYNDAEYIITELNTLCEAILEEDGNTLDVSKLDQFFNKLINCFCDKEEELLLIKTGLYNNLESFPEIDKSDLFDQLQGVKNKLERIFIHQQTKTFNTTHEFNAPKYGKVLYVDNNGKFGRKIKQKLFEEQIHCILASDINEALDILKKDDNNDITLLVCDYKFLNDKKQFHHKQAFHLSQELNKMPNLVNMLVFTGLNSYSSNPLTTQYGRMVESVMKSKVFYDENGLDKFCTIAKKLCKNAFEKIKECNAFKAGTTHKFLYKVHRESRDYHIIEDDIAEFAMHSVEELVKHGEIPKILLPNLNGRLSNKNTDKDLDNFRQILVGRRIVLGLCQVPHKLLFRFEKELNKYSRLDKKDSWYLLYNAIRHGELKLNYDGIEDTELHNVVNRNLRMSIKQNYNWRASKGYPLTIEEKNWLYKYSEKFANLELPEQA